MSDALFTVEDQVVLASGASRGIGYAIARGFAERGAQVVVTGRDRATLDAAVESLAAGPKPVRGIVCDVAEHAAIEACVAETIGAFGRIDTLLNVAGVNRRMPVEDYTPEDYDFILDINLKGAFLMSQAVGRHMIGRRAGNQINVDSLNSYAPIRQVVPYAMSKAGMLTMIRGLALEWGRHGVRVNGIAPGFILTDLTQPVWSRPRMREWNETITPLRRLGDPEDLVAAALFLASPGAAFVTGHTIRVDGGATAGYNWPIDEE